MQQDGVDIVGEAALEPGRQAARLGAFGGVALAVLAGVGATAIGNQLVFAATPNSDGLTVYDIDFSVFSSVGELKFDLSGANSVIVNVSGLGGTFSDNFVGGDTPFAELASKVVWNFHEATALNFDTAIWGTVLAPFAHVTNATPIEGTWLVPSPPMRPMASAAK